jgi:predicted acetyltransferase
VDVEVTRASMEQKPIIRNLLELYVYDYSEYMGWDVGQHGLFGYKYLDHYWTEPGRVPLLIRANGKLAGFVLVRIRHGDEEGPEASIAEFFVMRRYRRQGVGRIVARRVFDMFPGRWKVAQMQENTTGRDFWRAVIAEYTGGAFTETAGDDSGGTIQRFTTPDDRGFSSHPAGGR